MSNKQIPRVQRPAAPPKPVQKSAIKRFVEFQSADAKVVRRSAPRPKSA